MQTRLVCSWDVKGDRLCSSNLARHDVFKCSLEVAVWHLSILDASLRQMCVYIRQIDNAALWLWVTIGRL